VSFFFFLISLRWFSPSGCRENACPSPSLARKGPLFFFLAQTPPSQRVFFSGGDRRQGFFLFSNVDQTPFFFEESLFCSINRRWVPFLQCAEELSILFPLFSPGDPHSFLLPRREFGVSAMRNCFFPFFLFPPGDRGSGSFPPWYRRPLFRPLILFPYFGQDRPSFPFEAFSRVVGPSPSRMTAQPVIFSLQLMILSSPVGDPAGS